MSLSKFEIDFLGVSTATPSYWVTPLYISDAFKRQLYSLVYKHKVKIKL